MPCPKGATAAFGGSGHEKFPPFVKGRELEGGNVKIAILLFLHSQNVKKSKAGSYTYRYAYRVQTENKQKDV